MKKKKLRVIEKEGHKLVKVYKVNVNEFLNEGIMRLLQMFKDIFATEQAQIGKSRCTSLYTLVHRRIPPNYLKEVERHIGELLQIEIVSLSSSLYSEAIVIVRKKDNSLQLCVDYRNLNKFTIHIAFSIHRINESVEAMSGGKYVLPLDLTVEYHQIEVHPFD